MKIAPPHQLVLALLANHCPPVEAPALCCVGVYCFEGWLSFPSLSCPIHPLIPSGMVMAEPFSLVVRNKEMSFRQVDQGA